MQFRCIGKLATAVDAAVSPAAEILCRKSRLLVQDRGNDCKFLVDSEADVSILPWTKTKEEFRMQMFQQIHGFCHPGVKSTIKQMTEKFIWPEMKKQVGEWAKTCQKCKVNRHTKSTFGVYQIPDGRFNVVHIDLIGPLPPSENMGILPDLH
ncbi:retrovirus-related Pol polyprotein from transposon opus [Nephila pilipes]|uniref:RNA-directed DNA polymerase n=1 Tax=Nephila pilipes TaxID=299642 RepID=A0A8X6N922_NEPPI|nr:retrovirus-related Pol polyprotein from transposon opus [Nephila pilipes]GFT23486.1 retrovirus-related Pol polyprotein from transposon opus [Nephila pilipes]